MAKWGEGDPRWIVEERPDSTNVNNWHWTEKNCFSWSEKYLKEKLSELKVEEMEKSVQVVSVSEIEGESTVGNRKGKLYFIFDLNVTIKWKGETDVASTEGKIKVGDITQDDEVDEYQYKVTCDEESDRTKPIKELVQKKLLPLVKKVLTNFRTDIRTEHEKNVLLPTKQNAPQGNSAPNAAPAKSASQTSLEKSPSASVSKISDTKTVKMKVELLASAQDVYDALTNPQRVQIWTRAPAEISTKPGSKFSLFGGNISGELISVVQNKKIEQKWRLRDWPQGHFSTVTIELEQGSSSTEVELVQTGVPSDQLESTQDNWQRFYWNQIKGIFGWGILS